MSTNPHVMSKYATEIDCLRARDKWHQQRIAELERENAELRKDAERWKLASTDHRFGIANWCEFGMKVSYANHAEEIVDAAIASEKENRDVKTAL